jgi:hypothetical protein
MNSPVDWMTYHGSAKCSYKLVCDRIAVLPRGIQTGFRRKVFQEGLTADDFSVLMVNNSTFELSSATLENVLKNFCPNI